MNSLARHVAHQLLGRGERARARAPRRPRIATTSAGLAWSNGFADGNALPVDLLLASVRAIARSITVPLTVDLEGGYSDDPLRVADTVAALVEAGAVGINLEDGNAPPAQLAAKIDAIRRRVGLAFFINARTDVVLRGLAPEAPLREIIARAQRYRDAGADGLFVPKLVAREGIVELTAAISMPLNLLAWPGLAPASELTALGVRRLSSGSALAQGALGHLASAAAAFLRDGRSEPLMQGATPSGELNALFAAKP